MSRRSTVPREKPVDVRHDLPDIKHNSPDALVGSWNTLSYSNLDLFHHDHVGLPRWFTASIDFCQQLKPSTMSQQPFNFQPVIIIGAARSGTNMLRDMLTQLEGVGSWPCDEINYIWRHDNVLCPHDEFTARQVSSRGKEYIRRQFQAMAHRTKSQFLIEKTCANSLRVEFVDSVIPEAKYIYLVRDGRDVVLSALKRWKAALDLKYLLKKVPFVPWRDLPFYAGRYLYHRAHRLFSRERRLASWGPRFDGMSELLAHQPLDEVCAEQWRRSVRRSDEALQQIHSDRVHVLRYEDMVAGSTRAFGDVLRFLGLEVPASRQEEITANIFADSVGGWRSKMSDSQRDRIETIIGTTLEEFGYDTLRSTNSTKAA